MKRDINGILDDVRGMLMQIRAMASIQSRHCTESPVGERPTIDAFPLDDVE
jgi:hypothetical protein